MQHGRLAQSAELEDQPEPVVGVQFPCPPSKSTTEPRSAWEHGGRIRCGGGGYEADVHASHWTLRFLREDLHIGFS